MGDETLKSCPFCGRTPVVESHPRMRGVPRRAATCYAIICRGCYLPRTEGFDRARVVSDWNQPRYDEVRIRAEAMAERTRDVEALLRQVANDQARAGCSDEAFRALRIGITAIRASWPDAFPNPGSTT